MKLSIIIVSWKVKDLLQENLEAIFRSQIDFDWEIFVVDNNSGDGTTEMVKRKFPRVNLIANQENLGFARANNQAIKKARGDYILLLNPDMRVFPDTLANMISWADKHPEAGVAGCHLINKKGETVPQARNFPTWRDQMAIILKIPHIFPQVLNGYLKKDFDYSRQAEVDSIRGSFFLIRKEVVEEIGGLDEKYFIWFEEVDYCRQVWEAGWKVFYTPAARCLDRIGQSFFQVKKGKTQKYFRDSMLKYFRKWHPRWQYAILKIAWPLGRFITFLFSTLKVQGKTKT